MIRTLTILLLLLAAPLTTRAGPAPAAPPLQKLFGGPFTLTDHNGTTRTDRDFRGRFVLLTFGYTSCPDICPTNLSAMAAALDRLGDAGKRVTPVLISVDPARDTPAVLKDYMANFGARFVGLTGTLAQVKAAAKAYRVHLRIFQQDGAEGYFVDHGSLIYLIGPDGKFRTLIPHNTPPARMAAIVRRYVTPWR